MSFKHLKQLILKQGIREFKDIVSVLNDFEDKYKQKLTLFEARFQTGKVKADEFKKFFYELTDVEMKLLFLEETFSHNTDFLKAIASLRENLKEQQKLAFMEPINTEALFLKITEEGKLLALEEKLVEKAREIKEKVEEGFRIEETKMTFTMYGVEYLGEKVIVTWYKKLLDGGKWHTQDTWIKFKADLPDIALYHATFVALYKNRNGSYARLVGKMRKMFVLPLRDWTMTSTRIKFNPKGHDEIIHNYKNKNEYVMKAYFNGPSDWVDSDRISLELLNALLRSNNKKEIVKVYKWLYGYNLFLYRLAVLPDVVKEEPVILKGGLDSFNINCVATGIQYERPAYGAIIGPMLLDVEKK